MERSFVLELDTRKTSVADRTISATISSEFPVERHDGAEILSHRPGAVDLSRFPLPLCVSHDTGKLNVGLVEKPILADGRLRATLRFGHRTEAEEIWRDVQSGVLRYLSVGYQVTRGSIERREDGSYVVHKWQPYETSIVSAPADMNAVIGRGYNKNGATGRQKGFSVMSTKDELSTLTHSINYLMTTDTPESRAEAAPKMQRADVIMNAMGHPVSYASDGWKGVEAYFNRNLKPYVPPEAGDNGDDDQRSRFTYGDRDENDWTGTGEFFRDVAKAMSPGGGLSRKMQAHLTRASGLSEITPSDGGFLLPEQMAQGIFKAAFDTGLVASRVTRIPVSGNSLKIPTADETSRATGSRWGGIQSYWINEGGTVTATKPKFASLNLELEKLMSIAYVTQELLDDVPAMGAYLENAFRDEIAFMMDDAIINGTGAGMPLGVLNANCLVTVSKEDGQAADCIVYQNILAMWKRMPARNRKNSIWLMNQDAESELYQMTLDVGTGGSPVYLPAGGASVAPYSTLFSRPVVPIEQCAALGDLGDIILFDPTAYLLIEKNGGPVPAWSAHVRFLYDEMTFRLVYRVDGQPLWSSAITPFRGSNDLSMCVTLEAR
jgi:HK97 family phage major capsid protein